MEKKVDDLFAVPNGHNRSHTALAVPLTHEGEPPMPDLIPFHDLTPSDRQQEEVLHTWVDTNRYQQPTTVRLKMNLHPTLGFFFTEDNESGRIYVHGCQEGTSASRLPRWKSRIQHAIFLKVNDTTIRTKAHLLQVIQDIRLQEHEWVELTFAQQVDVKSSRPHEIPQLHYDQRRHLNQLHIALRKTQRMSIDHAFLNLTTRSKLKKRDDYHKWRQSEWQQHDKYKMQGMFAAPIKRPRGATVLPFVWT